METSQKKQFQVGSYRIDMERSQIILLQEVVSIEPKVLQVLRILAEHQGEVVSHKILLDRIWPDVHVAPNALQRCIAKLRKVFQDNAKEQRVIATHPKVGYSLLVEVDWLEEKQKIDSKYNQQQSLATKPYSANYWLISLLVILIGIIITTLWLNTTIYHNPLKIVKVAPLTTTDQREFSPSFSPDGLYVAFQRYSGECKNQIWAKELSSNKEILLTKDFSIYGTPSWSPDGQHLIFSNRSQCKEPGKIVDCRDISRISFLLAKGSPQATEQILSCGNLSYRAALWLDNNNILFLAKNETEESLISMNITNSKLATIYSPKEYFQKNSSTKLNNEDGYLISSISYSKRLNKVAIMQFDSSRTSRLLLIDPTTKSIERIKLNLPPELQGYTHWNVSWHPNGDFLIAAVDNALVRILLNGDVSLQKLSSIQDIWEPIINSSGTKIVASMGTFDLDLGEIQMNLNDLNQSTQVPIKISEKQSKQEIEIVFRSTLSDHEAQYQPNGSKIAFISKRSGHEQIWLGEDNDVSQLTLFSTDLTIQSYIWSNDGKLIFVVANSQLYLLNLDGELHLTPTPFLVDKIYQRIGKHELLLNIVREGENELILFNIKNKKYRRYYQGSTHWAQISKDGSVYIKKANGQLINLIDGNEENLDLPTLSRLKTRFFYYKNKLLLLDQENFIWRYEIETSKWTKLIKLTVPISDLNDINEDNNNLLLSLIASTKKEIVILELEK